LFEPLHELPKHLERLLLIFDTRKLGSPKKHVNNLFVSTHLLNIHYEDVVCGHFPYTFDNKYSTWYFNHLPGPIITNLDDLKKSFISKFWEEKNILALYKELGALKMENR
jgi:hypothetical protein